MSMRTDSTMQLDDVDLLDPRAKGLPGSDDTRHYQGVALKGAMLVADRGRASECSSKRADGTLFLDDVDVIESAEGAERPAPVLGPIKIRHVASASIPPPVPNDEDVMAALESAAGIRSSLFDIERIAPTRLAAYAFGLGVATTLVGVFIAL